MRTWERTRESLKKNVLEKARCDLYVCTYTKQYGYHPWIVGHLGIPESLNDAPISPEQIHEALKGFSCKYLQIIEEPTASTIPNFSEYKKDVDKISQTLTIQRCMDAVLASGVSYDAVLRVRFDSTYEGPLLPEKFEANVVYLDPNTYRTHEPSDLCYAGTPEVMERLLRLLNRKNASFGDDPHLWLGRCLMDGGFRIAYLSSRAQLVRLTDP